MVFINGSGVSLIIMQAHLHVGGPDLFLSIDKLGNASIIGKRTNRNSFKKGA
jgi:hypothetical protein